jgi:hypothetical protein
LILFIYLFIYTVLKIKKPLSKSIYDNERREINWFGDIINQNQASLFFGLSIIGVLFSIPISTYGSVSSLEILVLYLQEFLFYNPIPLTSISFLISIIGIWISSFLMFDLMDDIINSINYYLILVETLIGSLFQFLFISSLITSLILGIYSFIKGRRNLK